MEYYLMRPTDVRPAPYPRGAALWIPASFLGAGLLFSWYGMQESVEPSDGLSLADFLPQAILLLIGFVAGLWTLGRFVSVSWQRRRARTQPAEPWLWRKDWRDGRVGNTSMRRMLETLLITGGVAAMAMVVDAWVLTALASGETEGLTIYAVIAAAVTIVALFLVSEFLKAFLTWWRWRDKRLVLKTMPGRPGQKLAAELELPDTPPTPLRVQFGVYRAIRGGRNASLLSKGEPIWEASVQEYDIPPGARSIRLTFDIPNGRPQSDWSRHTERTQWQVSVVLDKRNSFEFEVPVFL